jgi:hypothetical protein
LKNSLEESKVPRISGGTTFLHTLVRTQSEEFAEEKGRQRSRPLRTCNSPKVGKKCASSGGSTAAVRSDCEEIWTVGFYIQEMHRRSTQGKRSWTVGCSHRYPSAIGLGRRCTGFNLSHTRQKSDSHQDIDVREIGSHEDKRSGISIGKVPEMIWTIRLWRHVAGIERPIGISSTGVWI